MYDKKLFCIKYIYNNMTISISLRFLKPNSDLWNVKTNKQIVTGSTCTSTPEETKVLRRTSLSLFGLYIYDLWPVLW